MIVVLAEKKSLAEKIAKALGRPSFKKDHYEVVYDGEPVKVYYLFGHVLKTDVESSLEGKRYHFPETLKLKPDEKRLSLFNSIKKALEEVKKKGGKVYCAGDPDREGELLVREVLSYCKVPKSICYRMWWNSETKQALKKAFDEAKPLSSYDHLYVAGACRQLGDFWLGINASRALQVKTGVKSLSLGRVQTPVLKLIADREREIREFKPEKYYVLTTELEKDGIKFTAKRTEKNKSEALKLLEELKKAKFLTVKSLKKRQRRVPPPKLPKLSDLQKELGSKYKMTAKEVLSVVQSLYEKEYLSYPRTDSNYLSKADKTLVINFLKSYGKDDLIPKIDEYAKRIFNDKDVERAGHHAIVPLKKADGLTGKEKVVYEAVVKRLLANLYEDAVVEKTTASFVLKGREKEEFKSEGEVVIRNGWFAVYGKDLNAPLPPLTEGEEVKKVGQKVEEKETQPPPRYTSATLIAKMEKLGLGTQATRHTYEETLIKRGYVERKGGKLYLTHNGEKLMEVVGSMEIATPELTASWEAVLKQIAEKAVNPSEGREKFLNGIRQLTKTTIEKLESSNLKVNRPPTPAMVKFAKTLAKKTNLPLTPEVLSSFEATKKFIDEALKRQGEQKGVSQKQFKKEFRRRRRRFRS